MNLAACLAADGFRVLLIDVDSQANATSGLGLEKEEGASAYRPLLGDTIFVNVEMYVVFSIRKISARA